MKTRYPMKEMIKKLQNLAAHLALQLWAFLLRRQHKTEYKRFCMGKRYFLYSYAGWETFCHLVVTYIIQEFSEKCTEYSTAGRQ